jgi:hypothetical protein
MYSKEPKSPVKTMQTPTNAPPLLRVAQDLSRPAPLPPSSAGTAAVSEHGKGSQVPLLYSRFRSRCRARSRFAFGVFVVMESEQNPQGGATAPVSTASPVTFLVECGLVMPWRTCWLCFFPPRLVPKGGNCSSAAWSSPLSSVGDGVVAAR